MTEIYLYDDIVPQIAESWGLGVSARSFIDALNAVPRGEPVTVRINSYGGDLQEGRAIENAIRRRGNVTVAIDGIAGSAASFVAMAGESVVIAENAEFWIHQAMAGLFGMAYSGELLDIAADLDEASRTIAKTYAKRSGGDVDSFLAMMAGTRNTTGDGTRINADKALELGLVDGIVDGVDVSVVNLRSSPLEALKQNKAFCRLEKGAIADRLHGNFGDLKLAAAVPVDASDESGNNTDVGESADVDDAEEPKDDFDAEMEFSVAEAEVEILKQID